MDIRKGGVVNYISQKGNVLTNEPPWYPTGLILANYYMNDLLLAIPRRAMTFTERKKALTLTGPIVGQEGRNISEKGILDTGVRARGREQ